jgi:preprotein translocase subunit SecG
MTYLLYLLVVIFVIVCLFLIGVVLLQTGKSADLAGAFGGQGSQTAFGPRGAANLLTKLTAYAAGVFMILAIALTIVLSRTGGPDHSVLQGLGSSQTAPVQTPAKK